jgi:hypothetical protein
MLVELPGKSLGCTTAVAADNVDASPPTDIVDLSSDQNAQDPLKKNKKPRYEKKTKKRNVEVVTKTPMSTAFDSSMGINTGYYINAVSFIKLYFLLPI